MEFEIRINSIKIKGETGKEPEISADGIECFIDGFAVNTGSVVDSIKFNNLSVKIEEIPDTPDYPINPEG